MDPSQMDSSCVIGAILRVAFGLTIFNVDQEDLYVYQTDPATVVLYRLPNIRVIKTSFPRPVVQGAFADRDMHSGQQHIPLAQLPIIVAPMP